MVACEKQSLVPFFSDFSDVGSLHVSETLRFPCDIVRIGPLTPPRTLTVSIDAELQDTRWQYLLYRFANFMSHMGYLLDIPEFPTKCIFNVDVAFGEDLYIILPRLRSRRDLCISTDLCASRALFWDRNFEKISLYDHESFTSVTDSVLMPLSFVVEYYPRMKLSRWQPVKQMIYRLVGISSHMLPGDGGNLANVVMALRLLKLDDHDTESILRLIRKTPSVRLSICSGIAKALSILVVSDMLSALCVINYFIETLDENLHDDITVLLLAMICRSNISLVLFVAALCARHGRSILLCKILHTTIHQFDRPFSRWDGIFATKEAAYIAESIGATEFRDMLMIAALCAHHFFHPEVWVHLQRAFPSRTTEFPDSVAEPLATINDLLDAIFEEEDSDDDDDDIII